MLTAEQREILDLQCMIPMALVFTIGMLIMIIVSISHYIACFVKNIVDKKRS